MRPVDKGQQPTDNDGEVEFSEYQEARPYLIERTGEFCSYCEMHLDADLAVEHVLPKSEHEDLRLEWENLLLACRNCNSNKDDDLEDLERNFWPDRDNTFRALTYKEGGRIVPNPELEAPERELAQALIELVGLDKRAGNVETASDRRWNNRREAWDMARETKRDWLNDPSLGHANTIVRLVKENGYWSVWMTVFSDVPCLLRRFIDEVPGVSTGCFDEACQPVARDDGLC